jgi:hypothetical protein
LRIIFSMLISSYLVRLVSGLKMKSSMFSSFYHYFIWIAFSFLFHLFFPVFIILATIIFVTFECRPIILDVFIPMNESRPRRVEMDFQLFVNQEQYFFLYLTHEVLGVLVGIWSIVTTAAFLNTIGKHFCATYKIARFCY